MRNSLGEVEEPAHDGRRASTIDGKTARAEVRTAADNQEPSSDTLELTKLSDGWKVSSLSAAPAASGSPEPAAP